MFTIIVSVIALYFISRAFAKFLLNNAWRIIFIKFITIQYFFPRIIKYYNAKGEKCYKAIWWRQGIFVDSSYRDLLEDFDEDHYRDRDYPTA